MYPSAETTRPVVGPVPASIRPTCSSPPIVSMRTTDGATRSTAAWKACFSTSSRSAARPATTGNTAASKRTGRPAEKATVIAERSGGKGGRGTGDGEEAAKPLVIAERARAEQSLSPSGRGLG